MKITLLGYGKMGRYIEGLAMGAGHDIFLVVDVDNRPGLTAADLGGCDVAIDFSRPDAAVANIDLCLEAGIPIVVGTTGWLAHLGTVSERVDARGGGLFWASNFSIGVNAFFGTARRLAGSLREEGYELTIEETHHTEKLDAPSGTAITLGETVGEAVGREVPITSFREAGVPGTHTLRLRSSVDTIELTHTAHSREGFARGALAAARWLIGRRGVFTMRDLLPPE